MLFFFFYRNGGKESEIYSDSVPVFNFVSSKNNPLTWGKYLEESMRSGQELATAKALWCFSITLTNYLPTYYLLIFLLHTLPALIVDIVLVVTLQTPRFK